MPRTQPRTSILALALAPLALLSACQPAPERSAGPPDQPQVNIPCCEGFKIDPPRAAPLVATAETPPLQERPRDPILDDPIANANSNRVVRPPGGWAYKEPDRVEKKLDDKAERENEVRKWINYLQSRDPASLHYKLELIKLDWSQVGSRGRIFKNTRMIVRCRADDGRAPCLQQDLVFGEILRRVELWSPHDTDPDAPETTRWRLVPTGGITCGRVYRGTSPMPLEQNVELRSMLDMALERRNADGTYSVVTAESNDRPRTLGYRLSNIILQRGGKWGVFAGGDPPPADFQVSCTEGLASGQGVVELVYADAPTAQRVSPIAPSTTAP